ncbi:hypothetical protein EV700_0178 [Fluviicoccus keumensis]|uniref:Uncharacterized protein n=1 Tax=Fluviicoccus keumensis TaxID=1435465 RepID=A0A4Q7ZBV2_9GAMM|nr:hypothetical protein [Fluviicoccus keumensis]RZU48117.1 hypothetical protein EV700_0178 [Fluviicoccus keumensis]
MLLSVEQKRQTRQYAFVNGFKNAAWLTGYVQRLSDSSLHLATSQPGITIPILLEQSPASLQLESGQAVSVYCRVIASMGHGQPVPMLKAIGFDRPNIVNLTPREVFRMALGSPSEFGSTPPVDRASPTSNSVHLSGLLERLDGLAHSRNPGIQLLIRQYAKDGVSIPVRIYGKRQGLYRRRLQVGMPVFIEGSYRVMIGKQGDSLAPFIQTTDVRIPQRGKDILAIPEWAYRYMAERTTDPEISAYIDQMFSRDFQDSPDGNLPSVIDEL